MKRRKVKFMNLLPIDALPVEPVIELTIGFSLAEAQALRTIVQNPLCDDEPTASESARRKVFDLLTKGIARVGVAITQS